MKPFLAIVLFAGCLLLDAQAGTDAFLEVADLQKFEKDGPYVDLGPKITCLKTIKLNGLKDDATLEDALNRLNAEIQSQNASFRIYVLLQDEDARKFWETVKQLKLSKILKWKSNGAKSPNEYLENRDGFSLLMELTPWCGASRPSFFKTAIVIAPDKESVGE